MPPLALWGGVECTVNRVGDRWRDQLRLSGHHDRPEDLERFAELGLTHLRYPVLWERVAPDRPDAHDWRWSDDRLARIRRLGMTPIVGLVHHGSGPRYTSLVADDFAPLLGRYAAAAAERYPDVADWTPVNEPLTTARFSALYGHWHPHARDERLFWVALLNQIDGTCAAMRAIRRINPAARLIQTEDLGRCYATDALAPVADHYNERRWMSWDLLAGRVRPDHPLWPRLARLGLGDRLRAIADDPCPPEVLGVNHYVTSDRFLDDRAAAAALPPVGYHDVAAARVLDPPPPGLAGALREAWARYGIPIAVTECQLGCTREEQVRWLAQAWRDCGALRGEGVDVRALTAWALLGATDWNSLLTVEAGHYEPGAFDVRGGTPRATATAALLRSFGRGAPPPPAIAAVTAGTGWWRRGIRLEHPPHRWAGSVPQPVSAAEPRPLLIAGATGTLGQMLARMCRMRGLAHVLTDRRALPLDDPAAIAAVLDRHRPWAVVNAAGWVRVDAAEDHRDACRAANALGAAALARACAEREVHCTTVSSDLVFGGVDGPHDEASVPDPRGAYAGSKAEAERLVVGCGGPALIVRTAAFFLPHDPHNVAAAVERTLGQGGRFAASPDHRVSPTYVPDLAQALLDLVIDGETGIRHLTNGEGLSWWAFARRIAEALGLDADRIDAADPATLGWVAPRPRDATLVTARGALLPPLDDAIARFAAVRRHETERAPPASDVRPQLEAVA